MQKNTARVFTLPVRINYEDTDAGGVVYYANYLRYMERARNECLRCLGLAPSAVLQRHRLLFVVTEAKLKYLLAARLDDEVAVTLELLRRRHASMLFRQQVLRDEQVLVDGEISVAVVDGETFTPCRMPKPLADALDNWARSVADVADVAHVAHAAAAAK